MIYLESMKSVKVVKLNLGGGAEGKITHTLSIKLKNNSNILGNA